MISLVLIILSVCTCTLGQFNDDIFSTSINTPFCATVLANDAGGTSLDSVENATQGGFTFRDYPPFYYGNNTQLNNYMISISAQSYHVLNYGSTNVSSSFLDTGDSWSLSTYLGVPVIYVGPDDGNNTGNTNWGIAVGYNIAILQPGTYTVWIYGSSNTGGVNSDSIHFLIRSPLNNTLNWVSQTSPPSSFTNTFVWKGSSNRVNVSAAETAWPPSIFNFYLAMREDGMMINRFVLTQNLSSPFPGTNYTSPQISCDPLTEVLYFPPKDFTGVDTFTYAVTVGNETFNSTATVYVGVMVPSPSPSVTPSASPTASVTPTSTPSATPSTSSSPTPSVSPTASVTPTASPSSTPSSSITPTASVTSSVSPTPSVTPTTYPELTAKSNNRTQTITIAAAVAGTASLITCALFLVALKIRQNKRNREIRMDMIELSEPPTSYQPIRFFGMDEETAKRTSLLLDSRRSLKEGSWLIDVKELKVEYEVGRGAFGVVNKGKWKGIDVAIKQLILGSDNFDEAKILDFFAEAELMMKLKGHPNITQLLGICADPVCLVTEFVDHGSLKKYLSSETLEAEMQIRIARDVAAGMLYLHSEGVIHRDLAARNILLDSKLRAKVSDFGMSRVLLDQAEGNKTATDVGPIRWMAPEAMRQRVYNKKTDIWSYGVVIYEILTRQLPYHDTDLIHIATSVSLGELSLIPVIEKEQSKYPPVLVKILKMCLQKDPQDRPLFENVIDMFDEPPPAPLAATTGTEYASFDQVADESASTSPGTTSEHTSTESAS